MLYNYLRLCVLIWMYGKFYSVFVQGIHYLSVVMYWLTVGIWGGQIIISQITVKLRFLTVLIMVGLNIFKDLYLLLSYYNIYLRFYLIISVIFLYTVKSKRPILISYNYNTLMFFYKFWTSIWLYVSHPINY